MGRFVPISYNTVALPNKAPQYTCCSLGPAGSQYGAKSYYCAQMCWQYKIVLDRPGAYCWQVPATAICARTVLIGGGGKPTNGSNGNCCSYAGSGGGYSEKCLAVTGGSTYLCIVVGAQQQSTTMSCNGTSVHTATGASQNTPGCGTGGDWNSTGGCTGYTCNYCGGSVSHYCGSCKYTCNVTLCGYCVIFMYDVANSSGNTCCNALFQGGASAGSPRHMQGGWSACTCGNCWNGVASGGAGIGDYCVYNSVSYNCCSCICSANPSGPGEYCHNYPSTASGGGGTKQRQCCGNQCKSWQGICDQGGIYKGGDGGPGGLDQDEGCAWTMEWGYKSYCSYPYGVQCSVDCEFRYTIKAPCKLDWWDISDICGTGSPGTVWHRSAFQCSIDPGHYGSRPKNAGEGAGTGGIFTYCCNTCQMGNMVGMTDMQGNGGPLVNWPLICTLGVCGMCEQAWLPGMQESLFPFFITCAGTLGGSGGVNWCGYTSKAGKGGGGGQAKCHITCICYGGSYNLCNGSGPALAFPPCLLDQLVSNAGTGMAIIYWREA
jgi:hypothetical protein